MNKTHLMIRQKKPWRTQLVIGVLVFAFLAGSWMIFDYGRYRAGFDRRSVALEHEELQHEISRLNKKVSQQREKIARLETAKQVDSHANREVRDSLENLQQEQLELREELQFYRSIVSPGRGRPGVHIHNFTVNQGEEAGVYYYNLTLIHIQGPKKHQRQARGVVSLSIEGESNGIRKVYDLKEISSKKKVLRFSFKYFARFDDKLQLPKDFIPINVVVKAVTKTSKVEGDEKKIKWPISVEPGQLQEET